MDYAYLETLRRKHPAWRLLLAEEIDRLDAEYRSLQEQSDILRTLEQQLAELEREQTGTDEAFGRGSDDSARYGLELLKRLNLQLLIVTPLQKTHIIEPFVASVGSQVTRRRSRRAPAQA